jgi:hypothetical protein
VQGPDASKTILSTSGGSYPTRIGSRPSLRVNCTAAALAASGHKLRVQGKELQDAVPCPFFCISTVHVKDMPLLYRVRPSSQYNKIE